MSPFLTGVLWGIVVLLGLVTGHFSVGETDVEPGCAAELVAASPPAPIPSAVIEPEPEETPTPTTPIPSFNIADLIVEAQQHYQKAQEYLQAGDWAGYGAELEALQAVLERLAELTGVKE